jgi:hypothetical protein
MRACVYTDCSGIKTCDGFPVSDRLLIIDGVDVEDLENKIRHIVNERTCHRVRYRIIIDEDGDKIKFVA